MIEFIATALALFWLTVIMWYLLRKPFAWLAALMQSFISKISRQFSIVPMIWFYALRGTLTVRAAGYLLGLADGWSKEEANRFAYSIDTFAAYKRKHEVAQCIHQVYAGNRLALISDARLRGFRG